MPKTDRIHVNVRSEIDTLRIVAMRGALRYSAAGAQTKRARSALPNKRPTAASIVMPASRGADDLFGTPVLHEKRIHGRPVRLAEARVPARIRQLAPGVPVGELGPVRDAVAGGDVPPELAADRAPIAPEHARHRGLREPLLAEEPEGVRSAEVVWVYGIIAVLLLAEEDSEAYPRSPFSWADVLDVVCECTRPAETAR